jgi:hypothetical protein
MRMSAGPPRVPLFDRLPEVYRTYDAEQSPSGQLRAYLRAVELSFSALHDHITQLYDDLFIDTCDDWVIPYLADLLGTTHLKGEARTLRADVADTIALRRRKGTLGAIERLAVNLTGWACRSVELRENLAWSQHLNHQRADAGGLPPYGADTLTRFDIPRGGTAPLRDPAALALLGTPFDTFAYTADVKPAVDDARHINLPNLAIFLWRLAAYRLPLSVPLAIGSTDLGPQSAGLARLALRFDLDPLNRPVRLFNTSRPGFLASATSGGTIAPLTEVDAVPGPMLDARLTSGSPAGHPEAYVRVDYYDDAAIPPEGFDLGDVGLHLFLPQSLAPLLVPQPPATEWQWLLRGDNLCAWEAGLRRPLRDGEIVIDPGMGRLLIGLTSTAQRNTLISQEGAGFVSHLYTSFTYAAVGPVGAHPVPREPATSDAESEVRSVGGALTGGVTLQEALENLDTGTQPVVIEMNDSLVHPLDIAALPGTSVDGSSSLRLSRSLTIRASGEHRPIVRLATPLAFRPIAAADATIKTPVVRLEGLFVARDESFPPTAALIARAAVARLEVIGCTLDPGGHGRRDGTRAPTRLGMRLANDYGFDDQNDVDAFVPTPDIIIQRSITGALAVGDRYHLDIEDTIVDAGLGVNAEPDGRFAIASASSNQAGDWGARLDFSGLTCFGPVRVTGVGGQGAIFTQRFEVLDDQHGCIKWSWFSGDADRLPPNHFCLRAPGARLAFTSERFNDPAYAQIARESDVRIRTLGPGDDAMGAFGFLLDAHKLINLQVRLREFMPVGVRPLIVPVT